MNAHFQLPAIDNEPVLPYAPGDAAREALHGALNNLRSQELDIPMVIGGEEVRTSNKQRLCPPHELAHTLGHYHRGDRTQVQAAVDAALQAKQQWELMPWEERAAIFLRAADLIAGPLRYEFNAATMLAQSKTCHQSEIDAVAELCDFLRFNVKYLNEIYKGQPESKPNLWNRMEYRALEGFVFAITPFNFTAIAGNLPTAPAMAGNTVVWKPADSQIYSAHFIMKALRMAGLPAGVINLVFVDGPEAGDIIFNHPDFAGLHFTGSTKVFKQLWKLVGQNIDLYKCYPRVVGETGGKDYILAHPTADAQAVSTAITRAAFEFQGQKCSAASRAYLPDSLFDQILEGVKADLASMKQGPPEDFSNFVTAVIDERAFDKISGYIDKVKASNDAEIVLGGGYDKTKGYFVEPTVVVASNPRSLTMVEEIFGPVITLYRYPDADWEHALELVDTTSEYALTGAIFCEDRYVLSHAVQYLRHSAGNFYINDKPTGSIVNQQPFGGARGSGTNDKAGSMLNLLRWVSARTIKENFVPVHDYRYPFLGE